MKVIKLISSMLFSLMLLSGWAAAQEDNAISRIRSSGELRVAFADSPPMQSKNPVSGTWEGFNVDMATDLASALGVKLTMVDASWATLVNGLLAGQYDIIMASTFATAERAQQVIFTDTYITAGEVVLVHRDSPLTTHAELNSANSTLTVTSGTTNERTARQMFPDAQIQSIASDNVTLTFMEVGNKRFDATVTDENLARRFLRENPQVPLRVLEPERILNNARRAYAIKPGEYHFLNFLNNWIQIQSLSGRMDEHKATWDLN